VPSVSRSKARNTRVRPPCVELQQESESYCLMRRQDPTLFSATSCHFGDHNSGTYNRLDKGVSIGKTRTNHEHKVSILIMIRPEEHE